MNKLDAPRGKRAEEERRIQVETSYFAETTSHLI